MTRRTDSFAGITIKTYFSDSLIKLNMKDDKNVSGLIIEGISGSGKTAILDLLTKEQAFHNKNFISRIVLSEHHTQRVLEQKERENKLCKEDNIDLLNSHVEYIKKINQKLKEIDWCDSKMSSQKLYYIFERFHFTHLLNYSYLKWDDLIEIDKMLAELNCKLCVLAIDRSTIEKRIITNRVNNLNWMKYIRRFGNSKNEIVDYFDNKQNKLLELAEKSVLPKIIIDTSIGTKEKSMKNILDFCDKS